MTPFLRPMFRRRNVGRRRVGGDRGSVLLETVLVTPVVIMLLAFVGLAGRTAGIRDGVREASRDAARAASMQRSPAAAQHAADLSAGPALTRYGVRCAQHSAVVDVSGFGPGGQVTVTLSCDVPLADLGLLGLPGTKTVAGSSTSVIDTARATR